MHQYFFKNYLFILIAIVVYKSTIAQSTVFNKNYNYLGNVFTASNGNKFYYNDFFNSCIEVSDTQFLCTGHTFNQHLVFPSQISFEKSIGILSGISKSGDLIEFGENDVFLKTLFNYSLKLSDSTALTTGYASSLQQFNESSFFSFLIKYNFISKEITLIDTFYFSNRTLFRGVKENLFNNSFYTYGFNVFNDFDSLSINFVIINEQLDNYEVLFINYYLYNQPHSINFINDSIMQITGVHFDNPNFNLEAFMFFYNYKSNTIESAKSYSRGNNSVRLPIENPIAMLNENYYIVASTRIAGGGPFPSVQGGLLIKTDAEGNELWQKTYNRGDPDYSEFFNGIKAHPDGTLIVAGGTRDYSYTPTPSAPRGWLIKMDTEGNIIWERVLSRYHEYNWDDYVNDVLLTSDGGIVLAGYVIHNDIQDALGIYHRNDAWLVKTDSCGFTTGDEPEPLILVQSNQELTIQIQNASQNYCTATLTWGDGTKEQIYAYSQPIYGYSPNLTHTYTQPGTYQVCIEALAGEEYRTYCTEINIEPNSINSLPQGGGLGEGTKIYPNPTKNYFILEFPNHPPFGGSEGGYSLPFGEGQGVGLAYSPTGQLVHQFEIKPQLQQKIDISHLPEGVYIIKIETNQFSTSKKLVVVR